MGGLGGGGGLQRVSGALEGLGSGRRVKKAKKGIES